MNRSTISSTIICAVALGAAFSVACAPQQTTGGGPRAPIKIQGDKTPSGFPTPSALEKLPTSGIEGKFKPAPYKTVDSWTLEGPFPELGKLEAHPSDNAFDRMLADRVEAAGNKLIANAQMACTAREIGKFFLKYSNYPSPALETFIFGRCGAPVVALKTQALSGAYDKKAAEDKIFNAWKAPLTKLMDQIPAETHAAGIWFGRDDKHAVVLLVTAPLALYLSNAKQEKEAVTLTGQVLVPASRVRAVINRKDSGVAVCDDNTKALPDFEIKCTGDPQDSQAWVEITAFQQGRSLGQTVARISTSPSGAPKAQYALAKLREGAHPNSAESLSAALLTSINRMRAESGAPPLELERAQSEVAMKLAPPYFAAINGVLSSTVADAVALGMRAGWNVEALVRSAALTSASTSNLENLDHLVESLLTAPSSREVLLDKDATKGAIGSVWIPDRQFAGAMIVTYKLAPASNEGMADAVLATYNAARTKAGLKPAEASRVLARTADRIATGMTTEEIDDGSALQRAIREGEEDLKKPVQGIMIPALDLSAIDFPEEMVKFDRPEIGFGVGVYRPSTEPWARSAVFVLYAEPEER